MFLRIQLACSRFYGIRTIDKTFHVEIRQSEE